MSGISAVRARWSVLRARFPQAAARAESAAMGLRGYARLVARVHALSTRMHELERDHALLAAHVATLSEQAFGGSQSAKPAALDRARLSAIASYEHRIQALEQQLRLVRPARVRRTSATESRTFGERQESVS